MAQPIVPHAPRPMPVRVRAVIGFFVATVGLLVLEPPQGYVLGAIGVFFVLQAARDGMRGRR